MLRRFVFLLVLANLLFLAFTQGWLEGLTGLRPHPERDPERLSRQVRPELVVIVDPATLRPAPPAPAAVPGNGTATATAPQCLEAGPFATGASVSAIATLQGAQPPLPQGSWVEVKIERPGSWLLYMGKFPTREALAKKEEELKRTRVAYERLSSPPELADGFALGRFDQRAAAERALEQLSQRGVRSARVIETEAPSTLHMLRVDKADKALAAQLSALKADALGRGFVPCGS